MAINPILIRIKSLFEKKGTDDAAKDVEQLGKKSRDAAKGTASLEQQVQSAGKASAVTSKEVAASARAMQALGTTSSGAAGRVGELVSQMSTLGPAAAAAAAVVAGREIYRHIQDAIEKQREFLREQQQLESANSVRRLIDGYSLLTARIDEASAARRQLMAAEVDLERATLERQLARFAREKEEALLLTRPDDQQARSRIEAHYERKSAEAVDAQRAEESARDRKENARQAADAAAKMEEAARNVDGLQSKLNESIKRVAELTAGAAALRDQHAAEVRRLAAGGGEGGILVGGHRAAIRAWVRPEIKKAERMEQGIEQEAGKQAQLLKDLDAARRNRDQAERDLSVIGLRDQAAGVRQAADSDRIRARETAGQRTLAGADPKTAAELDRLRADAARSQSAAGRLSANARSNEGQVAAALEAMAQAEAAKTAAILAKIEALAAAARRTAERIDSMPTR